MGFVGIFVEEGEASLEIQQVLSQYSSIILGRMGIPGTQGRKSVITLIVQCGTDKLGALTGRLGRIGGVSVKSALAKQ